MPIMKCHVEDCRFRTGNTCVRAHIIIEERSAHDSTPVCKSYQIKDNVHPKCSKCGSREFLCGCI